MKLNTFLSNIILLFCFTLITGCENTVAGFGKDMQHTGHEIQKSVN